MITYTSTHTLTYIQNTHIYNHTHLFAVRLYDPMGGEHMNIMKVGLQTAHQLVAVSRGYAWECLTAVCACVC
jgi:starch synthase